MGLRVVLVGAIVGLATSCGLGDQPPPAPPSVDVTGRWVGTIESTTPRGDPVYGPYTATFTLSQSGANVTGDFRSDIAVAGHIDRGLVIANRLTLSITTLECPGSLQLSATVRETPGAPAEMDVSYSGKTACAGEREGKGTLVKQ